MFTAPGKYHPWRFTHEEIARNLRACRRKQIANCRNQIAKRRTTSSTEGSTNGCMELTSLRPSTTSSSITASCIQLLSTHAQKWRNCNLAQKHVIEQTQFYTRCFKPYMKGLPVAIHVIHRRRGVLLRGGSGNRRVTREPTANARQRAWAWEDTIYTLFAFFVGRHFADISCGTRCIFSDSRPASHSAR